MTLELDPEIEADLVQRAKLAGMDVNAFLARLLADQVSRANRKLRRRVLGTTAERFAFLEAIAARHPELPGPVDSSRETIYADRGR
jgi:hypothetical protein